MLLSTSPKRHSRHIWRRPKPGEAKNMWCAFGGDGRQCCETPVVAVCECDYGARCAKHNPLKKKRQP